MIKLASDLTVTLSNQSYRCDLHLDMYASSARPCLVLSDSVSGEPVTKATVNPPPGYLIGFQPECFCWKDWSENEGLQAQLQNLVGGDGLPLFLPVRRKDGTTFALTLGQCKSQVYALNGVAFNEYRLLRKNFYEAHNRTAEEPFCPSHKSVFEE